MFSLLESIATILGFAMLFLLWRYRKSLKKIKILVEAVKMALDEPMPTQAELNALRKAWLELDNIVKDFDKFKTTIMAAWKYLKMKFFELLGKIR